MATIGITVGGDWRGFERTIRQAPRAFLGAAAKALNDVARESKLRTDHEMRTRFDRPTPWTLRAVATEFAAPFPDRLRSQVGVLDEGQGNGPTFGDVLRPEYLAGRRQAKRFEVLLREKGILGTGYYAVPAARAPLDAYGNVRNGFLVQLLAYFGAMKEQGSLGNMVQTTKDKLARRGISKRGFREIRGVQYFAIHPGQSHLHPGIYAKTGIHGVDVYPILMFVRHAPTYRQRIDLERIARRAADTTFTKNLGRYWSERLSR